MGQTLAKSKTRVDKAVGELNSAVEEARELLTRFNSSSLKRKFEEFGPTLYIYITFRAIFELI